jgi:hydroxyethylthiazole kinase-like uncharacterized protein yjeF
MKKVPAQSLSARDACLRSRLKELDQKAKTVLKIPEDLLIENASRGIMEVVVDQDLKHKDVCIFAGRGNNAADSLAFGRHLLNRGSRLKVFIVLDDKSPNQQVEFQLNILKGIMDNSLLTIVNSQDDLKAVEEALEGKDLAVDGVFGIGFRPPLNSLYKRLFRLINRSSATTLSVDIPSGLCADEGTVDEEAVKADLTVTFLAPKKGFFLAKGPQYTGRIFVKDIGLSRQVLERL